MNQKNNMGRYVEISKRSQALTMHCYKVKAHDYPEIKPFYIGLNEETKTVIVIKKILY